MFAEGFDHKFSRPLLKISLSLPKSNKAFERQVGRYYPNMEYVTCRKEDTRSQMSHNLDLKGGHIRKYTGDYYRGYYGDSWSLDYGSHVWSGKHDLHGLPRVLGSPVPQLRSRDEIMQGLLGMRWGEKGKVLC